ncbi:MAG: CCA tRNA nucleotidyltransferase [Candidatus Diapherotrites archaeon]
MSKNNNFVVLFGKVLKKIVPSDVELIRQKKLVDSLISKIMSFKGRHVKAELVGSASRGTNLASDTDLDIFVFYPTTLSRVDFERESLLLAKRVFGKHKYEKVYSEHPYLRGFISGRVVEIVPAYLVSGSNIVSAVDRSPLHNSYLNSKLSFEAKNEVRLLKQFLKGISCYGADLSSNSFSGYLTELLVVYYGSFLGVVRAACNWSKFQVVDVEGFYSNVEALNKFKHHLIVPDPVDKERNVAAALSYNQYARFIAACRSFVDNPSLNFFFPKPVKPWSKKSLLSFLNKVEVVAVLFPYPRVLVEDQVWGVVRRLGRKLFSVSIANDFVVKRFGEWVERGKFMAIVFEVESLTLQKSKIRVGPEVVDFKNSVAFLSAHKKIISGPRIENGRWVLEVERQEVDFRRFIKKTCALFSLQEKLSLRLPLKKVVVFSESDLYSVYSKNKGFASFFTSWLKGKETFLQ